MFEDLGDNIKIGHQIGHQNWTSKGQDFILFDAPTIYFFSLQFNGK